MPAQRRPRPLDRRHFLSLAALGGVGALAACSGGGGDPTAPTSSQPSETPFEEPSASPSASATADAGPAEPRVAGTVATGIEVPWGLAFLPSGDALVSERDSGRILRVTPEGDKVRVGEIDGVEADNEGGLLGIVLSPDGSELYAYLTASDDNRVVRVPLSGDSLGRQSTVLTGIAKNTFHNGGRLRFGPDDLLYVATGDAGERGDAQDRDSLSGKILRVTAGGDPAPDNPFGNEVFSYGHRNVQGLAFDDAGRLWASEFGNQRLDELNLIEAGANYGWPEVEGPADDDRYVEPQASWPTDDCSPSGIAIARSTVLVAGLAGECLYAVPFQGTTAGEPQRYLAGDHGRLRTVEPAPDGSIWLTTSNTDGRNDPARDDDKILRLTV